MPADIRCQAHLMRLRWPRPDHAQVHGQQLLGCPMHFGLPAKGLGSRLLLAVQKRLGRGGEVRLGQGCEAP